MKQKTHTNSTIRLALLLLMAWLLPGCSSSKPTLVLLVGGAGLSQLGEIGENISARCPDANVIETGGWDGFRANLKQVVKDHPCQGADPDWSFLRLQNHRPCGRRYLRGPAGRHD